MKIHRAAGEQETAPNSVDKHIAFDLWRFREDELNQLQLVFEKFPGMMVFVKSTCGGYDRHLSLEGNFTMVRVRFRGGRMFACQTLDPCNPFSAI